MLVQKPLKEDRIVHFYLKQNYSRWNFIHKN